MEETEEIDFNIKKYQLKCPICGKIMINNSPNAVNYNLKLHLEKHNKKE